jgi:predicted transcriptional regulator
MLGLFVMNILRSEMLRQRAKLNISQSMIAAKLGRAQRWVSMVENGEIKVDHTTATKILAVIERLGDEIKLNLAFDFSDLRLPARCPSRARRTVASRRK